MIAGESTPGDSALTALALEEPARMLIDDILEAAREYLDTDVAFVAEFAGGEQVFRHVAGDAALFRLSSELRVPLGWMYCKAMTEGVLSEAIPDTSADPIASAMEVTLEANIGSYVGVPISLPDGRIWGSMACVSRRPDHSVGKRDVRFMRMLARIYAEQLEREEREAVARRQKRAQIRAVLREGRLTTVLQPIVDLVSGAAVGYEALARFEGETPQPPDVWFAAAGSVGLGLELELAAVRSALEHLDTLPADTYLSVNVSPETAVSSEFADAHRGGHRPHRHRGHRARRHRRLPAVQQLGGAAALPRHALRGGRRRRRLRHLQPHPQHQAGHRQARHVPDPRHPPRPGAPRAAARAHLLHRADQRHRRRRGRRDHGGGRVAEAPRRPLRPGLLLRPPRRGGAGGAAERRRPDDQRRGRVRVLPLAK